MGKHRKELSSQPAQTAAGAEPFGWRIRNRGSVSVFAFLAAAAFLAATVIAPNPQASAAPEPQASSAKDSQSLVVSALASGGITITGQQTVVLVRDDYTVTKKVVKVLSPAPAAGVPDPGSAQAIGHELVLARGWGEDQYACLVSLFNRESHWNVYAGNQSSGAYGIPQALPGSKMASAGADWQTNPRTQITWGLNYIAGRYGTPCGAWGHSQSSGWY